MDAGRAYAPRPVVASIGCTQASALVLAPLIRFVEEQGSEALRRRLRHLGGLAPGEAEEGALIPFDVHRDVLRAAREALGAEVFERAIVYDLPRSWRRLRPALLAASPFEALQRAAELEGALFPGATCRVRRFHPLRVRATFEMTGSVPEILTRVRRSQWGVLPALSGFSPLRPRGDDPSGSGDRFAFEFELPKRAADFGAVFGALAGAMLAAMLTVFFDPVGVLVATLVASGAVAGLGWSWSRAAGGGSHEIEHLRRQGMLEIPDLAGHLELARRAARWARRLEEGLASAGPSHPRLHPSPTPAYAHDLRNALTVVRSTLDFLDDRFVSDPEGQKLVADMSGAISTLEELSARALSIRRGPEIRLQPERILTTTVAKQLRSRLRAFARGRGTRVSVFCAREAPDALVADPRVLDRILDQLALRSTRDTVGGSIVAQITGRPRAWVLQLSDTGVERPELALHPLADLEADEASGPEDLLGRALARLRGRLQARSGAGGTTVWLELPASPTAAPKPHSQSRTGLISE